MFTAIFIFGIFTKLMSADEACISHSVVLSVSRTTQTLEADLAEIFREG